MRHSGVAMLRPSRNNHAQPAKSCRTNELRRTESLTVRDPAQRTITSCVSPCYSGTTPSEINYTRQRASGIRCFNSLVEKRNGLKR